MSRTRAKRPRQKDKSREGQRPTSTGKSPRLGIPLTVSGILCFIVAANLHSVWIALPWLSAIALWGYYFCSRDQAEKSASLTPAQFSTAGLLIVLTAAAFVRWFKISELPLGPSADEIFTLNNSIDLLDQPFDLFGQTPLFIEGWVETTKLYLYFNLLIVKLFGASYASMKLFSVLPGVIACGAVFLIARLIFDERVAFWTALLFTFAHWPVRLSRYGWDASFMIMTFAVAIWLLLLALQRVRSFYAYLSGVTAGICLYSYLGARICVLSLLAFLFWEWCLDHRRRRAQHLIAFAIGGALVAFPLLCYYAANPRAFWVRTAELNVLNSANPLSTLIDNIWRHALMLFIQGGIYARDNYPGLAMLDPLTGIFFIAGLLAILRFNNSAVRLTACAFIMNFAPGIFSISQEGAPYVYRTAAVMLPTFVIVGFGLQWIASRGENYLSSGRLDLLAWPILLLTAAVNLYLYFGLEPKNSAAMRVMAYEPRLLGLEIARDNLPAYLVGRDLFRSPEYAPKPGNKYASANPPMILPAEISKLAVIGFSGRYDLNRTLSNNFAKPKDIYFVEAATLGSDQLPPPTRPAKIIFRSANQDLRETIRKNYPDMSLREIPDIWGEPILAVGMLVNSAK